MRPTFKKQGSTSLTFKREGNEPPGTQCRLVLLVPPRTLAKPSKKRKREVSDLQKPHTEKGSSALQNQSEKRVKNVVILVGLVFLRVPQFEGYATKIASEIKLEKG